MYWEEEAAAPERQQQQQGQDEEGEQKALQGRVEKQVGVLFPTACCLLLVPAGCLRVTLPD
eukprot:COSAG06_NODE_84_length_25090_cov_20.561042_7_plen_61_part_00